MDIIGKMAIIFGIVLALMFAMTSCTKTTIKDTSVIIDEIAKQDTKDLPDEKQTEKIDISEDIQNIEEPSERIEEKNEDDILNTEDDVFEPPIQVKEEPDQGDNGYVCPVSPPDDAVLIEGQYQDYFIKRYHMMGAFTRSVGAYETWFDGARTRPKTITCYDQDGLKTGIFKEWDTNNFLMTEGYYLKNRQDGEWKEWFNGLIKE